MGGVHCTRGLSRDSEIVLLFFLLPALLLRLLYCALLLLPVTPATGLLLLLLDCGACRSIVCRWEYGPHGRIYILSII